MKKCNDEVKGIILAVQEYKGKVVWGIFTTLNLVIKNSYNGEDRRGRTLNAITCFSALKEKKLRKKGYVIGEECTIKVNPDKPEEFCTEYSRSKSVYFGGLFFILLGVLVVMG